MLNEIELRLFRNDDAEEVSTMIAKTLQEINSKDYTSEYINNTINNLQPKDLIKRATLTHFYVAIINDSIVGCGAIGPYWGREDESSLFTIFVLPEYHKRGIGTRIVEKLEQDEFFLRAERIEVPASITAASFYLKMGYSFKNRVKEPDEEGLLRMEKRKEPQVL